MSFDDVAVTFHKFLTNNVKLAHNSAQRRRCSYLDTYKTYLRSYLIEWKK